MSPTIQGHSSHAPKNEPSNREVNHYYPLTSLLTYGREFLDAVYNVDLDIQKVQQNISALQPWLDCPKGIDPGYFRDLLGEMEAFIPNHNDSGRRTSFDQLSYVNRQMVHRIEIGLMKIALDRLSFGERSDKISAIDLLETFPQPVDDARLVVAGNAIVDSKDTELLSDFIDVLALRMQKGFKSPRVAEHFLQWGREIPSWDSDQGALTRALPVLFESYLGEDFRPKIIQQFSEVSGIPYAHLHKLFSLLRPHHENQFTPLYAAPADDTMYLELWVKFARMRSAADVLSHCGKVTIVSSEQVNDVIELARHWPHIKDIFINTAEHRGFDLGINNGWENTFRIKSSVVRAWASTFSIMKNNESCVQVLHSELKMNGDISPSLLRGYVTVTVDKLNYANSNRKWRQAQADAVKNYLKFCDRIGSEFRSTLWGEEVMGIVLKNPYKFTDQNLSNEFLVEYAKELFYRAPEDVSTQFTRMLKSLVSSHPKETDQGKLVTSWVEMHCPNRNKLTMHDDIQHFYRVQRLFATAEAFVQSLDRQHQDGHRNAFFNVMRPMFYNETPKMEFYIRHLMRVMDGYKRSAAGIELPKNPSA